MAWELAHDGAQGVRFIALCVTAARVDTIVDFAVAGPALGAHTLEFTFSALNSTPVTTFVPYTIEPNELAVTEAEPAPEATATRLFTVKLDRAVGKDETVDWSTEDGSPLAPSDFVAQSSTVVVPAGATTATFAVDVVNDDIPEPDETVLSR